MSRLNLAVVRELQQAIDRFRWCWDCGATDRACRATTAPAGKCCPDCRHRDTGAPYLAPLFTTPAEARRRSRDNSPEVERRRSGD